MGGRGAEIGFQNYAGINNIEMTDTFDEDYPSTRDLKPISTLPNKNFVVMASTDKIPEEILMPNLKKIEKMLNKNPKFYNYLNKEKVYIRTETISDSRISACFSVDEVKKQIIFNSNLARKNRESVENVAREQIKANWWTKSDKDELINHVTVHEFGHYVQRILIDKQAKKDGKEFADRSYELKQRENMRAEIKKICYNQLGHKPKTSRYGDTKAGEFFAETFCELYTSKNPSPTAKALEIYLKENL